jgi:hypothetical protein
MTTCRAGLPVLLCPLVSGKLASLPGSVSTLMGADSPTSTVHSRESLAQACASCTSRDAQTAMDNVDRTVSLFLSRHRNR